ncbi:MAG: RNA polymerase sigma factor [Bacteroidetes bacterium]|nr:RNA polymerase sigma factor [Bacteroidota bacterium]
MTDEQIHEAILREDASAQRLLYEKFARKMFGVCLRYTKQREEAEDLLQEGFIKVFQKISSYKAEGSLEGWIRRVMVNTALDHIRQQKMLWSDLTEVQEESEEPIIGNELGAAELMAQLQKLPMGYKTVFNLHAIEGYSHKEIGEMLGISEGTSKSQYSRARNQLMILVNELNKESIYTNK